MKQTPKDSLDLNGLCLEIVIKTLEAAFTAIARLLDTSKRRVGSWKVPIIDGDGPGFDLTSHTQGPADGLGIDAGWENDGQREDS